MSQMAVSRERLSRGKSKKTSVGGVNSPDAAVKGRDVADKLLGVLLADPEFLELPMSESALTASLNERGFTVKLSALREAVIAFVLVGWLVRTDRGVARPKLSIFDLIQLFGLRMGLERAAMKRICAYTDSPRKLIAAKLRNIVDEQEQLHENLSLDPDNVNKRIQWFRKSVDFHVAVSMEAGFERLGPKLENTIYEIRIGVSIPLEDPSTRAKTGADHRNVVDRIDAQSITDDEFIDEHIKGPMRRAMARVVHDPTELKSEVARDWVLAKEFFIPTHLLKSNPADQGAGHKNHTA